MSCDGYLWLLCNDGTCKQCGSSEGYSTKEQCIANHAGLPAVDCSEYCSPSCLNPKTVKVPMMQGKIRSSQGSQQNYAISPYSQLRNSWSVQGPFST